MSVVSVSVHVTVDCLPSEKITLQSETDAFPGTPVSFFISMIAQKSKNTVSGKCIYIYK